MFTALRSVSGMDSVVFFLQHWRQIILKALWLKRSIQETVTVISSEETVIIL